MSSLVLDIPAVRDLALDPQISQLFCNICCHYLTLFFTMKRATTLGVIVALVGLATAQTGFPECTTDLLRTDECAAVVNPTACYNQFRWSARTLGCIDGVDDTERKARVSTSFTNWN